MGDESLGLDREWGSTINRELAELLEHAVAAPRDEVEFVGGRAVVDEEIVVVGRVPVPEAQQALHGPERVERIQVDQFADRLLEIFRLVLQLGEYRPPLADPAEPRHAIHCRVDAEMMDGEHVVAGPELAPV